MNPEYPKTVFHTPCENLPADFYIITAHNPDGQTMDPSDNDKRDEELSQDLAQLVSSKFRITGMSRDRYHSEPGWGIGCSRDTAIDMGKKYQQEAIFRISEGQLFLIDCSHETETNCGQFALVSD